jgi:hypothetical protein
LKSDDYMDAHRQAINNSIFLNEQDIGKAL